MPHSSGGGSHRGGSHSRSSSRSSSGSSRVHRTQSSYFNNAYRYRRLSDGDVVYSTDPHLNEKPSKHRYLLLIAYIPFFAFIIYGMLSSMMPSSKLDIDYEDSSVKIEDNIGVIDGQDDLVSVLNEFQDKTGITPVILTEDNQVWKDIYDGLENYAYDYYVNHWSDEKHWLIVYTTNQNEGFEDWYFEGMQGDDADSILTSDKMSSFNDLLNRRLTDRTNYTVSDAFTSTFSDFNDSVMKSGSINVSTIVMLIFLIFIIYHCYMMVFYSPNRKYLDYENLGKVVKLDKGI